MKVNKHHKTNTFVPCPYKRQQLESNNPEKLTKPNAFGYNQAFSLLQAIELNRRTRLSKKCLAHLALYVSQAWEDKPCREKIQQLYYMMSNLLDTTNMDTKVPFEIAIQKFCQNFISTPTICPSVTLLIAISYVERLNKRYRDLKGTPGCGSRMIMVAFIMASKYIHDCLRLVIYTSSRERSPHFNSMPHSPKAPVQFIRSTPPLTPPLTSIELSENKPNNPIETLPKDKERTMRIARMEQEFLFFLNYDLSVQDPILLVKWAHSYQVPDGQGLETEEYTSADEGDDEMDDEET
ncbi:hypothetical protein BDF21DRAFT_116994 [Thamnidium elegans]|uniref:Cyclin N-terminal domain-containing protein n=1 Tax=Thamnidium elegans TaxID=101142 RepID=A0A8H7VXP3_9FUNG|nr:hypothetical protein INT48_004642 [Thamnidium elegans]KAI8066087.1 hypothetical protein BDF21DRAFT_116994 [Thamnidium elegans]